MHSVYEKVQVKVKPNQWCAVAICLLVILSSGPLQWAFEVSRKTPSCGSSLEVLPNILSVP